MEKFVIKCKDCGDIIYLTADGTWVEDIAEAYEFPEELAEMLSGYMNVIYRDYMKREADYRVVKV